MSERLVLHRSDGVREVVQRRRVLFLEAEGERTRIWLADDDPRIDTRSMGVLHRRWEGQGFVRIHRSYSVSLDAVHLLRRRDNGRDWELTVVGPGDRALPISRDAFDLLREALEE